jgi:hypothetical protein
VRGHISLLATNNGREPHLQNYNYKDCRKLWANYTAIRKTHNGNLNYIMVQNIM